MADPARFWNRLARRYARQPVADEAAYQTKLEKTRAYFTPASRVLELGCGTGSTALVHAPYVGHIRAIDFSEAMIGIAREKQAAQGIENIDFKVESISEFETTDRYDAILAMSVLHLLPDWRAMVEKIHDTLEPGGVFVSSTAVMGKGPLILRMLVPLAQPLGLLPPVQFVGETELLDRMREVGFEISETWRPNAKSALFAVARKAAG